MYQRPYKAVYRGQKITVSPWNGQEVKPFDDYKMAEKVVLLYQKVEGKEEKEKILDLICKKHWNLINSYAHEFSSNKSMLEDLVQRGYEGLLKAVDKFDPTKKASWITYLSWLVRGEMHHYVRDCPHIVKQPAKFYDLAPKITSKLESIKKADSVDVKKCFSNEEKDAIQEYEKYREVFNFMLPIQGANCNEEDQDLSETAILENHNLCDISLQSINDEIFCEQLKNYLSDLEFKIVYLCYIQEETKTAICEALGLSNYRLNKILEESLPKIKRFLE